MKHERDKKWNTKKWKEEKSNNSSSHQNIRGAKKKSQNYMFMQTIQFVRMIVIYTFLYIFVHENDPIVTMKTDPPRKEKKEINADRTSRKMQKEILTMP